MNTWEGLQSHRYRHLMIHRLHRCDDLNYTYLHRRPLNSTIDFVELQVPPAAHEAAVHRDSAVPIRRLWEVRSNVVLPLVDILALLVHWRLLYDQLQSTLCHSAYLSSPWMMDVCKNDALGKLTLTAVMWDLSPRVSRAPYFHLLTRDSVLLLRWIDCLSVLQCRMLVYPC